MRLKNAMLEKYTVCSRAPGWAANVRDSILPAANAGAMTCAPCVEVMAKFVERVLLQRPIAEALFHDESMANPVMTLLMDFVQVRFACMSP